MIDAATTAARAPRAWRRRTVGTRRVTTPTVLQMEAAECGAAALAIILAYHGCRVPLEELRVTCGVSRDGSKANNIIKAARTYGLDGKGYTREVHELHSLPLPAILFWDFSHFVVLEGFGHDRVYLNDPAKGRRTVSHKQFDESFTGVVLTFDKTAEFRTRGDVRSLAQSVAARLAGSRVELACLAVLTLALSVPAIATPAFAMIYVDEILVRGESGWLRPLLMAMTLLVVVKATLTYVEQRLVATIGTKLSIQASARFVWHVLSLPIAFFAQRHAGEFAPRVGLNDRVSSRLPEIATKVVSVASIAAYAAVMWFYDPVLAAVGVGIAVANLLVLRYVVRKTIDVNMAREQTTDRAIGLSVQGLQAIETVKSTGGESDYFTRWAGYQAKILNAEYEIGRAGLYLRALPPLMAAVSAALVLVIGALRAIDGVLTVGMVVAFQILMTSLIDPATRLVNLEQEWQQTKIDVDRLDDVLQQSVALNVSGSVDAEDSGERLQGFVELRHVTFGYSPLESPVLRDLSLSVKPGQRVALVGASGSGKSTVAKLIAGLYEPWSGEVRFDGRPRSDILRSTLNSSIAIVDQDVSLLQGTIRQNLALWDATLPDAAIVDAATDAQIHDDIMRRRGGYDSALDETGSNFSGGQRQRLEIARALAVDPRILILDEATSALDPHVEKLVDDALRRRGGTCVIVAHRLSTIRDCDEILVLDRGVVVQRGRHEEMAHVAGPYQRLIANA
jgi:NHLM bacteriocin system ABC transporter peptidase/ATP-binding protein